ncbi:hypothetical protein [Enterovibrio nigricans]|uniref:Uncharacterized protein n=1 Tax=Enterovibrio nigricans DSM 22720 TaxID=1121868 RepID=A0A1T4V4Q7_9GAMM|nr:hypothetical protein [Enterovibrio nigricans]PKF50467.1 hypothetical protein AT251_11275 [Enterovibrio nigricans]SKA59893.1 hypothetical protein SAMN02745132_03194 [Enterovibrio nigricans DSM 22720]
MYTPSQISQELNSTIGLLKNAKDFLEGNPFILDISNRGLDYVGVDSFLLDDKTKTNSCILPALFIDDGKNDQALFKTNLILKSKIDFLFEAKKNKSVYKVLLKYEWIDTGVGSITVLVENNGKTEKATGNLYKRIRLYSDDLTVNVMCNGPRMQISFS